MARPAGPVASLSPDQISIAPTFSAHTRANARPDAPARVPAHRAHTVRALLVALVAFAIGCAPTSAEFSGPSSADLESRIAALETTQAEQAAALDDLRAEVYEGLADLHDDEAEIDALRADLGATQDVVDQLGAAVETNGQAIEATAERVDTLWAAVEALQR